MTAPIRVLIVDDEEPARALLAELLGRAPGVEVVGECGNGFEAVRTAADRKPDAVFLDIEMPKLDGFEVMELLDPGVAVVFVTAYDQYAVSAFEEGAVDYVMKPLSGARVAVAVQRVKERMKHAPAKLDGLVGNLAAMPARQGLHLRWINAGHGDDVQLITVEEVCYFQSDTKYTRVVAAKREGLISKSIKELADELDPERFWQVHRATIVNLDAVASVGRNLKGNVVLRLKDRREILQVSQPYAHLFRRM